VNAGTLTMENGSKITGHMGARRYGVVEIYGVEAKFYMKGGQITGNRTSKTSYGTAIAGGGSETYATTAGVFLCDGLFDMSGGSITNNFYDGTGAYASIDYDLRIITSVSGPHSTANPGNPQFKLSGDAKIGSIIFTLGNSSSSTSGNPSDATPHIQLSDNFTGSVSTLNFALMSISTVSTIQSSWTSLPIRYFITGPGATDANISKFTLGRWSAGTSTNTAAAAITSYVLACDPGNGIYLKAK
jgi:hypothetical protein